MDETINTKGIKIIGFILSVMAGWIDTVGVKLFLKQRSSSMTGRGHLLGYFAYKLDYKMFISIALIIISFIAGTFISTKIAEKMGLIGSLSLTGILILIASIPFVFQHFILCIILIPMGMGCQNAGTSLTEVKRTTHLTGASTDMGINMARGNWEIVRFWLYRLLGFPLGSFIGFNLAYLANRDIVSVSVTLIIPAIIIILTGILQNVFLEIPILKD